MLKKVLIVLAVLVVLAILAIGGLFALGVAGINALAKETVERGGTYALQVPTTLDSADVGIRSGELGLSGLAIANPDGFRSPSFFTMNQLETSVDIASIRQDTIVVPRVLLSDVDVWIEKSGGKANYDVILENLKRFESKDPSDREPPQDQGGTGKQFVVNEVRLENITAHVSFQPIGDAELARAEVNIPEIVLENVGSESDRGVLVPELINAVIQAVLTAVVSAGSDLPGDIGAELQNQLAGLESLSELGVNLLGEGGQTIGTFGAAAQDAIDQAAGAAEEAGRQIEEGKQKLDEATRGVRDLLGGGDDDGGDGEN